MRRCKRRECNSQLCPCVHRKSNGRAAQSIKKTFEELLLYVWYFMFASWRQAESCYCFYRTFIVNNGLFPLYLQSFWIWITLTFEIFLKAFDVISSFPFSLECYKLCIDKIPEVAKTKVSKPKRYSLSKLRLCHTPHHAPRIKKLKRSKHAQSHTQITLWPRTDRHSATNI